MRGGVAVASMLLALLVAVPPAGAGLRKPTVLTQSMTVAATPHGAATRAVLTVTLHYEMQCGYAGAGPVVVTFPAALKLPKHFAAGTVRLAGKPVAALRQGRRVTVVVPPHKGIMCDLLGPGSLALTFTRAAGLVNPAPGSYRFTATHGKRSFAATLAIAQ